ncbi:MAG: hypothetical protein Q8M24_25400 [Pseudolabrys sp.]|nr:hypothetical protein [Pseudolabrys sp.]MDP2298789.1 hypothetical protein [Pseudolabrys sp.]
MRRMQRIVLLATVLAVMPALAGCSSFDPESLDIFGLSEKKKLPGDRRPVFPEGVPGVTQGVPPQYIKGNQPPADAALIAPVQAAPPPAAAAAEPKPKPKPRRSVAAAKPKPAPAAQPAQQPQQAQPQQAQPQQGWPQGSTPAPTSGGTANWPAPPPAGTFSR